MKDPKKIKPRVAVVPTIRPRVSIKPFRIRAHIEPPITPHVGRIVDNR